MKRFKCLLVLMLIACFPLAGIYAQEEESAADDMNMMDDLLGDFGSSSDTTGVTLESGSGVGSFSNPEFELQLSGDHSFQFHAPVDGDNDPDKSNLDFSGPIKSPRFHNELGIDINYKSVKLVSHWKLDLLMNDSGDIMQMLEAVPLENAIYWSPWKIKIGVGYQYYSWGVADKLNPTDNLNPQDYSLGINKEKLALLSASFNIYPTDWFSAQAVYAPFEQSDKFPLDFKKFILDEVKLFDTSSMAAGVNKKLNGLDALSPVETVFGLPSGTINGIKTNIIGNTGTALSSLIRKLDYDWADYDARNFLLGGKVNFFTRYVDCSFSYLYDVDSYWTPDISLKKNELINENDATTLTNVSTGLKGLGQAESAATLDASVAMLKNGAYTIDNIDLRRERVHRIGADVKANVDRFGIWLEAGYSMGNNWDNHNDNYMFRNDQLKWTAGFDFNFGPEDRFYMNLQYTGCWNVNFDNQFYSDYEDGIPDLSKMGDKSYMEEYYYRYMTNKLGSRFAGVSQGLMVNLKFPFLNNLLTPQITAGYTLPLQYDMKYDTKFGSAMFNPELDIMPLDSLHIRIGAELYYAWHQLNGKDYVELDRSYDEYGLFTNANNFYVMVDYKWGFDLKK